MRLLFFECLPMSVTIPIKSQIRWQCRRGMLELDVILERFVDKHFDALSDEDKKIFAMLLTHDDPVLYEWLMEARAPDDPVLRRLVDIISRASIVEIRLDEF